MEEKTGFWWIPGMYHPVRGYAKEEAVAAVGAGWGSLVERAWDEVTGNGGRIVQVKGKFHQLRIYFTDVEDGEREAVKEEVATLENLSRDICEFCGESAPGICEGCATLKPEEYVETPEEHGEWVEYDVPEWLLEFRKQLPGAATTKEKGRQQS